ncbi:MAG TPA: efflux RND transporter permease subunit [Thermoanaerobaculia bacterium]|nr:efflux RND transporter permease subunit [Thermoanaerobaculia bacterium]
MTTNRTVAIMVLLLVAAIAGIVLGVRLPSSIFPDVTFPLIKVIADAGEQPAETMMPTVTRPIEEAILRVPGIHTVRTLTSRGSTEMSADFSWGTNIDLAMQRVEAEIQRVRPDLPPDTHIDIERMNTAIFPILGYALTSNTHTQADLRQFAVYTLKPELIRIPGVSQVQIQGGRDREFQVVLDDRQLTARHLAATDVVGAIQANNEVLSAGLLQANKEIYLTLADGTAHSIGQIGDIPVPVPGSNVPATVGDLGTVRAADEISWIRTTDGGTPAVLVNLIRQPSASTLDIADGVRKLFQDNPHLLPAGVNWTTFYDQARFVSDSVLGVRDAILIGVALAALVLLLFIHHWRLTLIGVAAIPLTVAVVLLGWVVLGQTINLMTLGGIAAAIGLIADDAIVVLENITRKHEEGSSHPESEGVAEMRPALIGSSLSTILIFLPFALMTGVAGAFFKPLALTMAMALVISFLIAAFAVPGVIRLEEPKLNRLKEWMTPVGRLLSRALGGATRFFVRFAWVALLVILAFLGIAWFFYTTIGSDFLPAMDEGSIILDYWSPPGTSLDETNRMLMHAEKIIMSLPDVETYSRRTGTQLGFFVTEPNRGDYVVKLKPRDERRPVDDVIDDLRSRIAVAEPALHTDFGQILEDNIGDLTGGEPQPIDIRIFGEDQNLLQAKARQTAALISKIPGIEDVFDGIVISGPLLTMALRANQSSFSAAADSQGVSAGGTAPPPVLLNPARLGLTTDALQKAVEPMINGTVASQVRIGERVYDLRVLDPTDRPLQEARIRTPAGPIVPLGSVATLSTGEPEAEIDRQNLRTYLGVTARLSGTNLGDAVNAIRSKLDADLHLPTNMSIQYGGQYEQQQSSFRQFILILFAGLMLVAITLLFEFGDWRAPLLTAILALSSLFGVFAALLITGTTLNISSFVGMIMMVGIVGENSVFVIHEARLLLQQGVPVRDAWQRASKLRERPVAMTILATSFALAPLALGIGSGSQLQQPLAIAVIGGFILSGPIVLFLLPALYAWLDPKGRLGK